MTRKTARLYNLQRTIALLTKELGTPVAWAAWLADLRRLDSDRHQPDLYGLKLMPYAIEGNKQPLYTRADIMAFVTGVRAADPGMRPAPPHAYVFDDTPGIPWRYRHARRSTRCVKLPSIIGTPRKPRPPKVTTGAGPAALH